MGRRMELLSAVRIGWRDVILMIARKEKDFVASSADDHIEMIEHVATEDAQVGCRRVGKSSDFAANTSWCAVGMQEFQNGLTMT
jgi:hypothetical protein